MRDQEKVLGLMFIGFAIFYTYIWTFGGWLIDHIQIGWTP